MSVHNKSGASKVTINWLVDRFYTSRFNRDNMNSLSPGEDINNSRKHRLYNKKDIKDVISLFAEFFAWVITEENICNVSIVSGLNLIRDSQIPRIRKATKVDKRMMNTVGEDVTPGKYYVTRGRYSWRMWLSGDMYKNMMRLWEKDSERIEAIERLVPEMEEKNRAIEEG